MEQRPVVDHTVDFYYLLNFLEVGVELVDLRQKVRQKFLLDLISDVGFGLFPSLIDFGEKLVDSFGRELAEIALDVPRNFEFLHQSQKLSFHIFNIFGDL